MSAQEYVSKVEILKCMVSHLQGLQIRWLQLSLTRCLSRRKGSIDLKEIIIHMRCSVRYFPFHSKQGAAIFHCPRMQIKQQTKVNMNFAYLTIKLVKNYPFLSVLNHSKLDFPNKIKLNKLIVFVQIPFCVFIYVCL